MHVPPCAALSCPIACSDIFHDADLGHCGSALREDSYLTAQGELQWIPKTAVSSKYVPQGWTQCIEDLVLSSFANHQTIPRWADRLKSALHAPGVHKHGNQNKVGPVAAGATATQGVASTAYEHHYPKGTPVYYGTESLVATGHVTIASKHKPKYRTGRINTLLFNLRDIPLESLGLDLPPVDPATAVYRTEPYSQKIQLWDEAEYY